MPVSTDFIADVPEMRKYRNLKLFSNYVPLVYSMLLLLSMTIMNALSFETYLGVVIGMGLVTVLGVYLAARKANKLKPVINEKFLAEFSKHAGISFPTGIPITSTPHIISLKSNDGVDSKWEIKQHSGGFKVTQQDSTRLDA